MAIISAPIPNLINGVSQQPFALRLASQAELQENCYSSIVEGLTKRPPTEHVAKLADGDHSSAYVHMINRDSTERYIAILGDQSIRVFDFDGNEKTVNTPDGVAYLGAASPATSFSAVTIADYTFIVNKTKTVAMDASVQATQQDPAALVWVRQGNYSTDYKVELSGPADVTAAYTTPDNDGSLIQTDHIAEQLCTAIDGVNGYSCERFGSSLHISRADGADFNLSTEDSFADLALQSIKDEVQTFDELPPRAKHGFQVEIVGSPVNGFDNYYVEYDDGNGARQVGVWIEIPKPGRDIRFDAATMPHSLVRESDGTFTFKANEWNDCVAGDEETAPEPSFVGFRINDIFFYRNRLGFISDENVVFSRSGDFFHFWRETVTSILDTDPIDVAVSHVKVSILRHAVPFNESLLLFSDQTQFVVGANEYLTPRTAAINQTTEFETNLRSRPVGAGRFVYFVAPKGSYSTVREYYTDGDTKQNDATDITAHVPKLIPGDVFKLAASANESVMIALTEDKADRIYVYQWYFADGGEKVQSAWHEWTWADGEKILNADFVVSTLWIVVQRSDGLYLERMDIEPGKTDEDLGFRVHLDRRITDADCQMVYDPITDRTTITLPYAEENELQIVGRGTVEELPGGFIKSHEVVSPTTIKTMGDVTGGGFFVGRKYVKRYKFSPLVLREEAPGGGVIANTDGRLQLRRMTLNFADSGYFRVQVTPFRRSPYEYVFSGRVVGSARSPLGQGGIETGKFRFPIMANNFNVDIEIVNDSPFPSRFLNADWEAQYIVRSQRMG
ncbi:hypothetical protein GTQ45_01980 [Pyruvatibacter mobilis]|uniref:Tail tubular protein B n=1 Tax=Pyruvatibacter mobilis TaxID=1712261 RepID=A0A845Q8E5_9HYPH|nr:hypothetical protein [Pyruvatibacter mobilis]NBG94500.1 hypothetical protein [Pyruvatibacter mobilis]QJD74020.1 hypothetical protein HG718_00530 [Pyruvatibacter mobilis]GGD03438.1 hypothetical protein GCM10011587_03960 [Pyruvatibacter mobilis]